MNEESVRVLRDCARRCDARNWSRFEARFRRALVAGVVRALARGGGRPESERVGEFLQEVYCRLLEDGRSVLKRFRGSSDAQAFVYLKRVAETTTLDQLRQQQAAKRGRGALDDGGAGVLDQGIADTAVSPELRLLRRESRRLFWRECRRSINSKQAARDLAILQLALFEGWSSREIAEQLPGELTVSSVDSIVHRLRRRLSERGLRLPGRSASAREVAERLGDRGSWSR